MHQYPSRNAGAMSFTRVGRHPADRAVLFPEVVYGS
jgi:hypothetical protein